MISVGGRSLLQKRVNQQHSNHLNNRFSSLLGFFFTSTKNSDHIISFWGKTIPSPNPKISAQVFSRPGQSQGLLYKHLCHFQLIDWLKYQNIFTRPHAQTVKNGDSSHKKKSLTFLQRVLKGINIAIFVQKLQRFCWMGGFCLVVELTNYYIVQLSYPICI